MLIFFSLFLFFNSIMYSSSLCSRFSLFYCSIAFKDSMQLFSNGFLTIYVKHRQSICYNNDKAMQMFSSFLQPS